MLVRSTCSGFHVVVIVVMRCFGTIHVCLGCGGGVDATCGDGSGGLGWLWYRWGVLGGFCGCAGRSIGGDGGSSGVFCVVVQVEVLTVVVKVDDGDGDGNGDGEVVVLLWCW